MYQQVKNYSQGFKPLTLSVLEDILKIGYDGKIFIKESEHSNEYLNLESIVNNIEELEIKSNLPSGQMAIMEARLKELEEENYQLKERLDRLEMMLGEN